MFPKNTLRKSVRHLRAAFVTLLVCQFALGGPLAVSLQAQQTPQTQTPIKHVIVIIGENRTFDHVFATYKPKQGEKVDNLLSKEIINADGTPGPNYSLAEQFSAQDTSSQGYQVSPMDKTVYSVLPAPLVGGPTNAPLSTVAQAQQVENGLASDYYVDLTTGGTGLTAKTPDTRIPNVNNLPPGPFQLSSSTFPYDAYAASPVHRFYQMWQQLDCNYSVYSTIWDASGCKADLFPWVEVTIGAGSNGLPQTGRVQQSFDRRGRDLDGLLQHARRGRTLLESSGRSVRHER